MSLNAYAPAPNWESSDRFDAEPIVYSLSETSACSPGTSLWSAPIHDQQGLEKEPRCWPEFHAQRLPTAPSLGRQNSPV